MDVGDVGDVFYAFLRGRALNMCELESTILAFKSMINISGLMFLKNTRSGGLGTDH